MNPWAESLGPEIIIGFALQQLLELIDPLLEKFIKPNKSIAHGLQAFMLGLVLSLLLDLRALRPFGITHMGWLDTILKA
jgi:hypothetical protein